MRPGFVILSAVVHGVAVAAALGFVVHAGTRLPPPARVSIQTSVASAPATAAALPEPVVVVEAAVDPLVARELPVADPETPMVLPMADVAPRTPPVAPTRQRVRPPASPAEPAPVATAAALPAAAQPWVDAERRADNEPPRYPEAERNAGHEGTVVLTVTLDARGTVLDVALRSPSPFPGLNREALRAVRQWRFEPARCHGVAVASTADVTVEFRLRQGR